MPFLFFFLFFTSLIYANTVEIDNTFKELHRICIYNGENDSLELKLKVKNSYTKVCLTFEDAGGIIESKCDYQEVNLTPDDLREKVIYYLAELSSSNEDEEYNLTIKGDEDLVAGECPSDGLAKVANTSADNIAGAAMLGGVLVGVIFFASFAYALLPNKES